MFHERFARQALQSKSRPRTKWLNYIGVESAELSKVTETRDMSSRLPRVADPAAIEEASVKMNEGKISKTEKFK